MNPYFGTGHGGELFSNEDLFDNDKEEEVEPISITKDMQIAHLQNNAVEMMDRIVLLEERIKSISDLLEKILSNDNEHPLYPKNPYAGY